MDDKEPVTLQKVAVNLMYSPDEKPMVQVSGVCSDEELDFVERWMHAVHQDPHWGRFG